MASGPGEQKGSSSSTRKATESTPLIHSPRSQADYQGYESSISASDFAYSWDYLIDEEEPPRSPLTKSPASSKGRSPGSATQRKQIKVSLRRKIWRSLEGNPQINFFFLSMIALSTIVFCLETVNSFRKWEPYFYGLECFIVAVFTLEYVVRFLAAPMPTLTFVFAPMNLLDLVAIAPFYIHYVYEVYEYFFGNAESTTVNMTTVRCLRLARIFKFGRYSQELSLVTGAFMRSSASFVMLSFMLGIALVVFSTLMYLAEQGKWNKDMGCYARSHYDIEGDFLEEECSPFQSIPHTFWWAITTMTTVGYGDTYPVTPAGKVIGGCAMIGGLLSVALPTTVLGVQFGDSYQAIQNERERWRIMQAIPCDDERHEEIQKQVQLYSSIRQEIVGLRKTIDAMAIKLVDEDERPGFTTELKWFGETVDNSGIHLETVLRNVETPRTNRLKSRRFDGSIPVLPTVTPKGNL